MANKLNCWEFKKCGREPNGLKCKELGVCQAATELRTNSINGGRQGGRACWVISGTLCGGKVQGTFAEKLGNCLNCEFYKMVRNEEGAGFVTSNKIIEKLKS